MDWFSGGVAAAITSCRQENAIFIVYVYDNSSGSEVTDEAWSSEEVSEFMSSRKYKALKVVKGSLEYDQFSQLYAVFLVPSIFCIGRMGQVLVAMNGPQTASLLQEKLLIAFQKYDAEAQSSPVRVNEHLTTLQPINTATASTCTSLAGSEKDSKPNESKEEMLKRYQEKIKERRQERAEDEFKKDKHRELQRREHGKDVAKLKQEREEQQTRNWLKERQKQKEEARLAREAVKAKLEQDKLERQSKQKDSGQSVQLAARHQQQAHDASHPVSSTVSSGATLSVCRIQLKLPAGNTKVVEMDKADTLEALRVCVAKEISESVDNIVLCSSYPRKELGTDSNSLTMVELQLVPSGVVIVRVKKDSYPLSSGSRAGAGIVGILMNLINLLLNCVSAIKDMFVALFSGGRLQESAPEERQPSEQYQKKNDGNVKGVSDSGGLRIRKFRQEDYHDDDSEEDGTYNGNSTQQQ